jgi:hypothetical protein
MPIEYGELTIIYNKEETTLFTNLIMWLNYDVTPPKASKYVFLFDDGEICDLDDNFKDLNFKFLNSTSNSMPVYFQKKSDKSYNKTYFYKNPIEDENNKRSIDFKKLFSAYTNFSKKISIASIYNCIYYCHKSSTKPEVFGIIRINSNDYMPRFQFAYDSDEFTKKEIIYLIHYIFNHSNLQNV